MKWHFLTILRAISKHTKWPKGSIPRSIALMMYTKHVLRMNVDWSTPRTEGFATIGQELSIKRFVHIFDVLVQEWFRNNLDLFVDPRTIQAVGGRRADRGHRQADEGRGWAEHKGRWVDDGLALPEWEAFSGFVAPIVEGVGIAIDGTVEALFQQHNVDVHAYKVKIDHLESMLASLGIHEPLQLLPTTSGVSTS